MKKKILDTANSLPFSNNNFSDKDNNLSNDEKHRFVNNDFKLNNLKSIHIHSDSGLNFGKTRNLIEDFDDYWNPYNAKSNCRYEDFFTNHSLAATFTESWQYDLSSHGWETCSHTFEYDEFETDEKEDPLCIPEIEPVLIGNELSWTDLAETDELDEINDQKNINCSYINEQETTAKLNRFEKATLIATEIIQAYDWGKENISLLEQVFYENGWGMARVSIERELNAGLIPEELALALFIRQLWTENPQYWISFIHITSNQPGQETKAVYKNMSWAESLRIIRSFNNVPSEEELQLFIYQIYDDWYCSATLQQEHKAFFKYLQYYTDISRRSLPGENEIFSFVDSYYIESL